MLNTDMTNKLFDDKHLKKLKDTFSNLKNDDEFEIMFGGYNKTNSLNMKQFFQLTLQYCWLSFEYSYTHL